MAANTSDVCVELCPVIACSLVGGGWCQYRDTAGTWENNMGDMLSLLILHSFLTCQASMLRCRSDFFDANASLAIFSSLSQASHRLSVSYAALWLVVQHGAMLAFNFNLNAVPTAIVAHPWPRLKWIYWYMEQKPFIIKNILRYFLYQSWIWAVQDGQDAFPSNLSVGAAE